jgi:ketosteroid isomerase-like protein
MRFIPAVIAFAITTSALGLANDKSSKDQEAVTQIEQEMLASLLKGDTSAFERYLADTFTLTDPDGMFMNKTRVIEDVKSGDLKFESSKLDDMKVQVYGDTAVATYVSTDKGSYKGKSFSGRARWTDVFIKRNGRWQNVAGHGTRLTQE